MSKINKSKAMAALIRSFFNGFTAGTIDARCPSALLKERIEEKDVKQIMLDQYDTIFSRFFDIAFYTLSLLTFPDAETQRQQIGKAMKNGLSYTELLKIACGSEENYDIMVEEYKYHFTYLLQGRLSNVQQHLCDYTRGDEWEEVDTSRAISAVVRTAVRAYIRGLQTISPKQAFIRPATVYGLLLSDLLLLLHEAPLPALPEEGDLGTLFLSVCKTPENYHTIMDEMNRVYYEAIENEGMAFHNEGN